MKTKGIIEFYFEDVSVPGFSVYEIRDWLFSAILNEKKKCGEISVVFCNDDFLQRINSKYLQHFDLTDVITFDYSDECGFTSGDIFISIERVKENAVLYEVPFPKELNRVIIHGVLHLIGYSDSNPPEKNLMTARENYYLSLLA